MSSGSLHIRSQKGPSCGISHTRSMVRTCASAAAAEYHSGRPWRLFELLALQYKHPAVACLPRQLQLPSTS